VRRRFAEEAEEEVACGAYAAREACVLCDAGCAACRARWLGLGLGLGYGYGYGYGLGLGLGLRLGLFVTLTLTLTRLYHVRLLHGFVDVLALQVEVWARSGGIPGAGARERS